MAASNQFLRAEIPRIFLLRGTSDFREIAFAKGDFPPPAGGKGHSAAEGGRENFEDLGALCYDFATEISILIYQKTNIICST